MNTTAPPVPVLCRLQDLPDPGARGFLVQENGVPVPCLVVRLGDAVYGYRNRCPHTGVNLDWIAERFLDADGAYIQCATHGALFRITDGHCVQGPCAGQGLEAVALRLGPGGEIMLAGHGA